jgi:REP element-mobilizing transposase RayT
LRKKKVPLSLYDNIASKLNALNTMPEHVTGVQCREKLRSLKSTFDEVKRDNAVETWEFGGMMKHIFDAPFEESK